MCERCVNVVKECFPDSDDEFMNFVLWEHTAFPMGQPEQIERQVREFKKLKMKGGNND